MSPIELLRNFFDNDEILRPMANPLGFAKLVGRSESLIRSLEKGRLEVTEKLARRISSITGVPEAWLQGSVEPTDSIPCRDGGELTVEKLKDSIMNHGFMPVFDSDEPNTASGSVIQRTMIDSMMAMVRAELIEYNRRPNPNVSDPLIDLLEWVQKRIAARNTLPSLGIK